MNHGRTVPAMSWWCMHGWAWHQHGLHAMQHWWSMWCQAELCSINMACFTCSIGGACGVKHGSAVGPSYNCLPHHLEPMACTAESTTSFLAMQCGPVGVPELPRGGLLCPLWSDPAPQCYTLSLHRKVHHQLVNKQDITVCMWCSPATAQVESPAVAHYQPLIAIDQQSQQRRPC